MRSSLSAGVRPFVCPSRSCIVSTKIGYHKLLSRPVSPIILVFQPQVLIPNSNGNPSAGAQDIIMAYIREGTICNFRLKSPFNSETVLDRLIMSWNVNRKSQVTDRSVSVPMTLSDPITRVSRSLYIYKSNISKRCV